MIRRTGAGAVVALGIVLGVASPARAADPPGWESWLMPTGTACVQTGGTTYWPMAQVVAAINATDINVVAKPSCAGYARNMTVTFHAYYDGARGAVCGQMFSTGWTWRLVRGVWTWTPNAPYIKLNMHSAVRVNCHGTHRKRLYLLTHEILHVFGLGHACCITVMRPTVNEIYVTPTWYDVQRINRRY